MIRRRLGILLAVLLTVSLVVNTGYGYVMRRYNFPGPLPDDKNIVIPHGTPEQVADALKAAGALAGTWEFRIAALATRGWGPLHAGEFTFPRGATLREMLVILRTARPAQHHVTIPDGLTAAQIATLIDRGDGLTGDTPVPPEGRVMPETYAYDLGTTRAALLARAEAAMDHALAQAWAKRDGGLPLATEDELLTVASIVERETAKADEQPLVAAVFLNRLRLGMKLQADPTVIYAASGGSGVLRHPITHADLAWDNPYNTYQVAGLPPGPISNPSPAALAAVAHPAKTDDLYFVADGNGGHVFARTLEDHNRNVARWRALNAPLPAVPAPAPAPAPAAR
jgi:UPF0755 protein